MINAKLIARITKHNGHIDLLNCHGSIVATFESEPFFYIVTGFKSADAYNAHYAEEPVKFLVWKREH